jgi:hypothetical protein
MKYNQPVTLRIRPILTRVMSMFVVLLAAGGVYVIINRIESIVSQ